MRSCETPTSNTLLASSFLQVKTAMAEEHSAERGRGWLMAERGRGEGKGGERRGEERERDQERERERERETESPITLLNL